MSQPSISELLASSEGKTLEFKRDLSSLKQIIKTVIAFANTAGGTLVIGRNDDGSIPGIDDPLTDTERLANAISDSISPHILPEIDIASAKGKSFLTVRVAHWPGPFYLKAEGSEQGVYIRLGSTNRQAGPEYLAELIRIRRNISFDQLPFGMILDDFKSGVSKIRNRIIARTFRELNLMEEWGSGFKRVIDACRQGEYPEPVWQEVGPAFRVTFYPHPEAQEQLGNVPANVPVNVPVNKRQEWFLEQLRDGKNCKASDLAIQWQVTEKTAKRDIADLKKKQLIVFSGAPKIGQYSIKAEQTAL